MPHHMPRRMVEECRVIDLDTWRHFYRISPGNTFWAWWPDGMGVQVEVLGGETPVSLLIGLIDPSRQRPKRWTKVAIDHRLQPFGGYRLWMRCPDCGRRVGKLHLPPDAGDGRFRCRCCLGLAYRSQSLGPLDRALWRVQKLDIRFGGDGTVYGFVPPRPKGLHRRTWVRRFEAFEDARMVWLDRLGQRYGIRSPFVDWEDGDSQEPERC